MHSKAADNETHLNINAKSVLMLLTVSREDPLEYFIYM